MLRRIPWVLVMAACSLPPSEAAQTVAVVDGDTLIVAVAGVEEPIRLIGINAPELDECYGPEARRALEDLVAGRRLSLERDRRDRDDFDRLLRHVYADGVLVAERLVEGGFALAHAVGVDRLHADRLEHAEARAEEAGAGWWDRSACGPARPATVEIVQWRPDPVGRDVDRLESESISLVNKGDSPLSLAGWVLRDSSSRHRYSFPHQVVAHPGQAITVFTGCGPDSLHSLYWCRSQPVWDNLSDDILLLNETGAVAAHVDYETGSGP